jgi:hypothetical protein
LLRLKSRQNARQDVGGAPRPLVAVIVGSMATGSLTVMA